MKQTKTSYSEIAKWLRDNEHGTVIASWMTHGTNISCNIRIKNYRLEENKVSCILKGQKQSIEISPYAIREAYIDDLSDFRVLHYENNDDITLGIIA